MSFAPIAIVGQACLLPGAHSPTELASNIYARRGAIGDPPAGAWRLPLEAALGSAEDWHDRTWTAAGGYVTGFERVWDPQGLGIPASELAGLDPLVLWLLHTGRAALRDAGVEPGDARRLPRAGAVFGNLSFPTEGMARWGEAVMRERAGRPLLSEPGPDPRNHFMSGLPAALLARGLGLSGGAFALDAACASSIYAIKLACDALSSGRCDLMLAGAVNRADSLFLHIGFCALGAMSRTGRSRPFHREADGLLPAEGAAFVALKRLEDAERSGDRILGIIRGIGLSNDGRGRSLVAPSAEGQLRAMRAAYAGAGLRPQDVQLVECHATGTPAGDRVELESLGSLYEGAPVGSVSIGSLKSMLGHLITAAGVAGLLKVLAGFAAETLPPTLHEGAALPELDGSPFRLVEEATPWDAPIRRAAVSAFGFGGNNGHLVVEQPRRGAPHTAPVLPAPRPAPVAITAVAVIAGDAPDRDAFTRALYHGAGAPLCESVALSVERTRFPPNSLRASLGQQLLILRAAQDAVAEAGGEIGGPRAGAVVGMGCDGAITGWGLRWRSVPGPGEPDDAGLRDLRARAAPSLRAEHVIGSMPNIVANRLNGQLDLGGASFTVSDEELSGLVALREGVSALVRGELDTVLVGAVEVAGDVRIQAALDALGERRVHGDAAVVLVLRRLADAQRDGSRIYAVIDDVTVVGPGQDLAACASPVVRSPACLGRAHAASGLVDVAAAALACRHGRLPEGGDWEGSARAESTGLGGTRGRVLLSAVAPADGEHLAAALATRARAEEGTLLRLELSASPTCRAAPSAPTPQGSQIMPVAPWLPPALDELPPARPRVPLAPPAAPAQAAHPELLGAGAGVLEVLRAGRQGAAQVHHGFLSTMAEARHSFATRRQQTAMMLLSAAGGWRADAIPGLKVDERPAPPAAAPLPPPAPPAPLPPPAPPAPLPASSLADPRPGPRLSRADLERGASGPISELFGPLFAPLDGLRRVVRMPKPPLLLADRVLGISGPPTVMGRGTIWTETDVTETSWYLHDRHMPAGVLIEAGQADLLLACWQGVDLLNRSERVYRLLGCDLTFLGGLPEPGDTLSYEIHVDGHARLGDVRMFFFHYDCTVGDALRLRVRGGQAGFFTDAELSASGGVLWDAASAKIELPPQHAEPVVVPSRPRLDRAALQAFSEGQVEACFGPSHALAATHTWTPRIAGGRMQLLDRAELDPTGGPWGRGYLRAELDIAPDLWFFEGHFENDPCMPGTLMLEGCLQAMQLYMTALGFTLARDGWRFEPARDLTFHLRCRGQVVPSSRLLTYEIFVVQVEDGPRPRLTAQVLCTVDGLKCFHADPLVLEMVPDWPLRRMDTSGLETGDDRPCEWGHRALLACAWGRPSEAFGAMYLPLDGPRRVPRLPGPPYHFMSRVVATRGEMGAGRPGGFAEVEYDVPPDAWYFGESGQDAMPFAVLLEAALQPCGWLASWTGCVLTTDEDLMFRNLDGTARVLAEVRRDAGRLRTEVELRQLSRSGGMIICGFKVRMWAGQTGVFEMDTVFGFFPPSAFASQAGVGSSPEDRAWLETPGDLDLDLRARPARYFGGALRMPGPKLLMLDRVTGWWPQGGAAGLGRWRAEKRVDASEWMFKAHFFQDPVQPGSLGLEAMLQLLQLHMLHQGYGAGMRHPRFEALALNAPLTWKYRGQVTPGAALVQVELEITATDGDLVTATGHLWVDGTRIYTARGLALRVVEGADPSEPWVEVPVPEDHAPTYVIPALPMMTMATQALEVAGCPALRDGVALRWFTFPDGPRLIHRGLDGEMVTLSSVIVGQDGTRRVGEPFFRGRRATPTALPDPEPLRDPVPGPQGADLYASGVLFHGPAFHVVERVVATGSNGATLLLRSDAVDRLLDGATHGVPHDHLERWCPQIARAQVGYPARLRHLAILGATPRGPVRCEVRFSGLAGPRSPVFQAHFYDGDRLWACFELEEILLPAGRLGMADPVERREFLLGRPVAGLSLSRLDGESASLSTAEAAASDWLPGTLGRVYGTSHARAIAVKELEGARLGLHPRQIGVEQAPGGWRAWDRHHPLRTRDLLEEGDSVRGAPLAPAGAPLDLSAIARWWRTVSGCEGWPGEDILHALIQAGMADLVIHDPDAFQAVRGRPVLYLGNHESYLESAIFCCVMSALGDLPVNALAKVAHREGWLGRLHDLLSRWPGVRFPGFMVYFDQDDPGGLPGLIQAECASRSLLVHVEGTRQTSSGQPVQRMSSLWVDVAVQRGIPIVPVAFRGGVAGARADLPVGPQDHHIGRPLMPDELASLPYAQRRRRVLDAINALPTRSPAGPPLGEGERPEAMVGAVLRRAGLSLDPSASADEPSRRAWLRELQAWLGGHPEIVDRTARG